VARLPDALIRESCRRTLDHVLQHGYDTRQGGFYEAGPLFFLPPIRDKVWWVQAEGMLSALVFYRMTGERSYWDCFQKTLDWIANHQVDKVRGGWYLRVKPDGRPVGAKAEAWKDPYHEGRAVMMALEMLSSPDFAGPL
jgi:mannose/cellobiose epimerase-like protein (N-acyl-D-glucosamine 2-epimerase family)